ncbi:WD repeat-containing protein 1 [Dinochytrium kinnereticum]|nr:WD repeat-containing protein 1 [Dinochytrium kinnereticum]
MPEQRGGGSIASASVPQAVVGWRDSKASKSQPAVQQISPSPHLHSPTVASTHRLRPSQMSYTKKAVFPPQPTTTRGHSVNLGEDPKGVNFLYTSGRSVIIRNIDNPLIATEYWGHSSQATVAKYSPSGFYIASGDAQGNVRIWDATQPEQILKTETRALGGRINDISWDFESKRLIAVGEGKDRFGHAFLFDTASSVGEISGHSKTINATAIRPGRPLRAVTCSDDMTVNFYHGVPFKFNKSIKDHTRFVQSVKYSPNGDFFATSGMDAKIFLYDGKTGDLVSELTGSEQSHTGGIMSISWSPDSNSILSSSMDMTAKVWDVSRKQVVNTFTLGSTIEDQQVGSLWQGKNLISLSLAGDINYLDMASQKVSRSVKGHQKAITALAAISETTFVAGSYDGRVLAWDESVGSKPVSGTGHANQVTQFYKTGDKVASIGMDDTLRSIDVPSLSFDGFQLAVGSLPKGIASNGAVSVVISGDQNIRVISGGAVASVVKVSWTPTAIALSPSATQVAIGDEDRTVHIFSLSGTQLQEVKTVSNNRGPITVLSYSPDGGLLASADKDRMIIVYGTDTWEVKINNWVFHNARINTFAWSPDGRHAASGSLDTNIEIWSVEKPTKHITIKGAHLESVNSVQFLNPSTLVSAGQDGALKVWSLQYF